MRQDTNDGGTHTFVLAMVMHSEVVKKAHEELDRVVVRDRLPEFLDKLSLPYITAITQEVLRWNPVAPLGVCYALWILNSLTSEFQAFLIAQ